MASSKMSTIALGREAVEEELDSMVEWMISAEGQAFEQARALMEEVWVDARARQLLCADQ